MASTPGSAGTSGRNWPLIVALLAAFALVFAVLPNPFRIPSDEPTTAAEFAPVPGKKDQSTQTGSFSGVGFAEGGGFGAPPPPPPPPPLPDQVNKLKRRHKNVPPQLSCVKHKDGKYHQTNDPLSPICVPYFDGDNGGATMRGVSEDEIRVVLYGQSAPAEDGSGKPINYCEAYRPAADGQNPSDWDAYRFNYTVHRLLDYFQSRYQTYGRRVCIYGVKGQLNEPRAQQEGGALRTMDLNPAGAIFFGNQAPYYYGALAKEKVPSFGLNQDVPLDVYEDNKPYVWSFTPDTTTMAELSASFLCRTVIGGRARLSRDPDLQEQPRKLGLIFGRGAGSHLDEAAPLLQQHLKRRCGFEFPWVTSYQGAGSLGSGGSEAGDMMARAKLEGVTTIVCYCVPTEGTVTAMQNAATQLEYFPEWYWDHASYMWRGIWNQTYGSKDQRSFGTMYFWRNPAFRDQLPYKAFRQMDPTGEPNTRHLATIYYNLLNLFSAIQGAGPQLQPGWAEKGMFTFFWESQEDPYIPTGGYGPYGPRARSSYTFLDTFMAWWWDPTGTPPGGRRGEGCIRVMNQGRRYYPDQWPTNDAMLLAPDAPCSEDGFKLNEAQAGRSGP